MSLLLPAPQEICAIVTEELALVGGTISDAYEDGERLFLRSLLPMADQVRPKDVIQGGIAVMADEAEIHVHPYLLRQVCRNGAIMPQLIRIGASNVWTWLPRPTTLQRWRLNCVKSAGLLGSRGVFQWRRAFQFDHVERGP